MRALRLAICALAAFGVLAYGGVEDWARAVIECGAGLLFVLWAAHVFLMKVEEVVIAPILPPLAAFFLVSLCQYLFRATAAPYATRAGLLLLLAYMILIFLATQTFRSAADWRGFVWFAMFFGFAVSVFGVLQHLTFNGKLYWFREMRYGGIPFGPYVNRNHFAGFAELMIPLALVPLVLGKVRHERRALVALLALMPIGALILSASRGGIISLAVELVMLGVFVGIRRTAARHMAAGVAVLALAVVLVSWIGVKQVLGRFSSLQTLEVTESKRASMRADTWRIFRDHPLTGTGLASLQIVYPRYETLYDGKIVNHAHNDYLEALAETGLLGGLCCMWFLGVLYSRSLKSILGPGSGFAASLHLAALVGCTGFLVHSLVDFNLHIPGNALLFFVLALLASQSFPPAPAVADTAFTR